MNLIRIYKLIPYILIILAVGAIAFLLLSGNTALLIKTPIFILSAFIIGSLIIILTKKHHQEHIHVDKIANLNLPQRTLRRCYIIGITILSIVVLLGFKNSAVYLILVIVLCVLIILQILSRDVSVPWVIFEILYLLGLLIFPFVFSYAYYSCGSDIIYHTYYAKTIADSGCLNLFAASGSTYAKFPGMHISTAIVSLITSLPVYNAHIVSLTLTFLGFTPFIYLLIKQFIPSITVGLLSLYIVLMYSVCSNTFALMTYASAAYIAILFIGILYLLFRKDMDNKRTFLISALPLIVYIILVHHANQLVFLGIIFFFVILAYIIVPLTSEKHSSEKKGILNIGILISYFLISAIDICYLYLSTGIYLLQNIFSVDGGLAISQNVLAITTETDSLFSIVFSWFSSSRWMLIIPGLIGMYLLLINSKKSSRQYFLGLFMLVFFVLFSSVSSVIPFLNNLMLYRYDFLIVLIFSIGICLGILYVAAIIQKKGKMKYKYISQVIIVLFGLIILVSPGLTTFASENDLLSPLEITKNNPSAAINFHFTTEDIALATTLNPILPKESVITVDSNYGRYLGFEIENKPSITTISSLFKSIINGDSTISYPYVILREIHLLERSLQSSGGNAVAANTNAYSSEYILPTLDNLKVFSTNINGHNVMYTNGEDIVYCM